VLAAAAAALAPVASAQAAYFPGQPADGPSADIVALGGVTLSRDSDGQVVYLKRDAGANHVFVSFLAAGSPRQPRRLDTGQATSSSQPRVSSSAGGRAVAVWVNDGSLWASVRPNGASDWGAPEALYAVTPTGADVANPSLSMGPSGAAYVAFEVAGDLRVARLAGTAWNLIDTPLDIDPAQTASDVDIATSADGTALAAWSEGGKVFARRVLRTRLSANPQEVSVPSLDGQGAGGADSPTVDIEDDSSYAWVALRQDFEGGSRVFARRLVGSEYEAPVAIDAGTFGVERPDLDLTGRGRGLAGIAVRGSQSAIGATLGSDNLWDPSQQLGGGSAFPARPVAALSENGRGTVAWQTQDGSGQAALAARYFNARRFEDQALLSDPSLGPIDGNAGFDASADDNGNQAIAYVQGTGADRRVMVAVYDKEPRETGGKNFSTWTRKRSFKLAWSKVEDPWGAIQYRVEVDGLPVTTTGGTRFDVRDLPDGAHVWDVVATDSRGQTSEGPGRALYVDTNAPTLTLAAKRSKAGRPAAITLSAFDGEAIAGSGVASVAIRYGDGSRGGLSVPRIGLVEDAQLGHRYRKPGRYTVRVEAKDKAGNKRVQTARVVVGK
jgi:hypothetical protein